VSVAEAFFNNILKKLSKSDTRTNLPFDLREAVRQIGREVELVDSQGIVLVQLIEQAL